MYIDIYFIYKDLDISSIILKLSIEDETVLTLCRVGITKLFVGFI